MKSLIVWHFANSTLRDDSPLPHKWDKLPHIANPVSCNRGWHGSVRVIDALDYAPGSYIARRKLHGEVIPHKKDKHCASDCTMASDYFDASTVLRKFAHWCTLTAARVDAADAMRKAGLIEQADELAALSDTATLKDIGETTLAASAAAWAAREDQNAELERRLIIAFPALKI